MLLPENWERKNQERKNRGVSSGEITNIIVLLLKILKYASVLYFRGSSMPEQQKEIEYELFEVYNKNLDRFYSLIKFILLIFGVYILTLSIIYGKLEIQAFDSTQIISVYSLSACLLFISISLIFPLSQLVLPKERKFRLIESSVKLREEEELKIYNKRLFLVIRQQENYHITSHLLVLLSFIFFCGHFVPFAICISVPVFIVSILYYLTFSEWIKRENKDIKTVQHQEG